METVRVELLSDLLKAANLGDGGNFSQAAARLLALEVYREDKVSRERAATLCQTPLRYNYEDLGQERRSSDHLKA
jgi:hypothetical protein